jgi:2-polyprenyl-3-methyl-5-hydroxy-6-metoxy-1,4-benzoquinol methylase
MRKEGSFSRVTYELGPCPICSGRDATEIADSAAIQRELERVWTFHARRFRHPVPPTYLTDRVVFSQSPPLRLIRCTECTHLYRNPRESPEAVRRTYSHDELSESVYETLFENQRMAYRAQVMRLLNFSRHIERGLEVGSYMGGFLAAARDAGLSFTGIDVNRSAAEFGAQKGLSISTCTLEEIDSSQRYDTIAIWNTFEQLPDVKSAALIARRLLETGGVLVVRVPNAAFYMRWRKRLEGIYAPWAERVLVHNNLLGFPYREGFTPHSLHRLLDSVGFSIERVHGDTLVPIADRWTNSLGVFDELLTKKIQRLTQRGWRSPWVEVYAVAR